VKTTELLKAYYGAFNQRNWSDMLGFLTEDVRHDVNQGPSEIGKDKFKAFLGVMDEHYTEQVKDLVVMASEDGARASAEFFIEGTYKKSQEGLPPARGQFYRIPVGAFFDIKSGKIARVTNYYNLNDWMEKVR
jgi:steroid delta-isomerase-like uncharacterized protein